MKLAGIILIMPAAIQLCSASLPPVVVQYGEGRTATTLQFQILCASMCLKYGAKTTCDYNCDPKKKFALDRPVVCKYHDLERALLVASDPRASFFATATRAAPPDGAASDGEDAWRRTARALERAWANMPREGEHVEKEASHRTPLSYVHPHAPLSYVQTLDALALRGYRIALDYVPALNLSEANADALLVFIRHWDVLRVCCGSQLSSDYRNRLQRAELARLHNNSNQSIPQERRVETYKAHRAPDDPLYDACETYDLAAVEHALLETRVFRECHGVEHIKRVSGRDAPLTGSYCNEANANIAEKLEKGM